MVSGFHHHEEVARLGRLHDEVEIAVRSLPRSDAARRFHEGASDMSWRDGETDHRVCGGTSRHSATIDHSELEAYRPRSLVTAPSAKRRTTSAHSNSPCARTPLHDGVRSARLTPVPAWNCGGGARQQVRGRLAMLIGGAGDDTDPRRFRSSDSGFGKSCASTSVHVPFVAPVLKTKLLAVRRTGCASALSEGERAGRPGS